MSKHTPGPWRTGDSPYVVQTEDGWGDICVTEPIPYDEMGSASGNARLIAAAPELLEALEGVVAMLREQFGDEQTDINCADAIAAIKKARGEE